MNYYWHALVVLTTCSVASTTGAQEIVISQNPSCNEDSDTADLLMAIGACGDCE